MLTNLSSSRIFWIAAILAGICAFSLFFILQETHLPTLITRSETVSRCSKLRRLRAKYIPQNSRSEQSVLSTLSRAVSLPGRLAFGHYTVAVILILILIFNGLVNIILSSLGSVYQANYHFPPTTAGLSYLEIGFGGIAALATAGRISDYFSRRLSGLEGSKKAEHNFPLIVVTQPVAAIGLIWYGWPCQAHVYWFVPIWGLSFVGYTYMSIRVRTTRVFHNKALTLPTAFHSTLSCGSRARLFCLGNSSTYSSKFHWWCIHPAQHLSHI
jgi:hypothetical protein